MSLARKRSLQEPGVDGCSFHRIKAFTPVSVLLISFALKLKEPSQKLFAIVCLISVGVASEPCILSLRIPNKWPY